MPGLGGFSSAGRRGSEAGKHGGTILGAGGDEAVREQCQHRGSGVGERWERPWGCLGGLSEALRCSFLHPSILCG